MRGEIHEMVVTIKGEDNRMNTFGGQRPFLFHFSQIIHLLFSFTSARHENTNIGVLSGEIKLICTIENL